MEICGEAESGPGDSFSADSVELRQHRAAARHHRLHDAVQTGKSGARSRPEPPLNARKVQIRAIRKAVLPQCLKALPTSGPTLRADHIG